MIAELVLTALLAVSANAPTQAQRARADLSLYFSTDDYPADAVRRRAEGTVSFRLEIDPTGRVVGCTITRSSNDASLDSATCAILRARAQYQPARGENGRPIASIDTGRVTWRLPALIPLTGFNDGPRPVQRARANLMQYFTSSDFPESARLRRMEGAVGFRLAISAEGRVIGCMVTRSSGDSSLDEATCAILTERARYEPARDAEQRAVADTDVGRVTWRFPPGFEAASLDPTRIVTRMRRVAAGDVRCTVVLNGALLPGETRGECGELIGTGAGDRLLAPGGPAEIVMVFATGRPEAAVDMPGADEVDYGQMALETVTSLSIARDGRIGDCRTVRMIQSPELGTAGMDGMAPCDLEQPGGAPYFQPSTDAAPRRARMRTAIFVK